MNRVSAQRADVHVDGGVFGRTASTWVFDGPCATSIGLEQGDTAP